MAFSHNVGGHAFTERGGRCLRCDLTWAFYCDNCKPRCAGSRPERERPMQIEDE
jgi:hypothetical protein